VQPLLDDREAIISAGLRAISTRTRRGGPSARANHGAACPATCATVPA